MLSEGNEVTRSPAAEFEAAYAIRRCILHSTGPSTPLFIESGEETGGAKVEISIKGNIAQKETIDEAAWEAGGDRGT